MLGNCVCLSLTCITHLESFCSVVEHSAQWQVLLHILLHQVVLTRPPDDLGQS